jgi:hypothetical protein
MPRQTELSDTRIDAMDASLLLRPLRVTHPTPAPPATAQTPPKTARPAW